MQAKNDRVRYGTVAMAFHWTIALLIFANVGLGIYFVNFLARQRLRGCMSQSAFQCWC
jgi:cytochrome b561